MNILITGAKGFVGKNLVENLKNIRDGKNRTRPNLFIGEIYEFDKENSLDELNKYCQSCDFVFNLAGVNRPKSQDEFQEGNYNFAENLLICLEKNNNLAPVMLSSSIQASLAGRFAGSAYGESKLAGEQLFFNYSEVTGAPVYVYRFPNLAGKWCKPNYNSAVATFCNAIANDLEYHVNDRNAVIELLFIDDLIEEMLDALEGKPHRCDYPVENASSADGSEWDGTKPKENETGKYCFAPVTHTATLGEIVDLLHSFKQLNRSSIIPDIPAGSLSYKLYSMYLSYLPKNEMVYPLNMKVDNRGVFTELIKNKSCGQVSINIARPGIVRGEHWHNTKWEIFIVVSGHGLIKQRKIGTDEVINFEVRGEDMKAVIMVPGYAHSITNLETDRDLVTVMWANEEFDQARPDTFYEAVDITSDCH